MSTEVKMQKQKLDQTNKMLLDQRAAIETNMKDFVLNLVKDLENGSLGQIKQFGVDLSNVRIENGKYHIEARNNLKIITNNIEEVNKIKNDYITEWQQEKEMFAENRNLFDGVYAEFKKTEKNHDEITTTIKVNDYL